MEFDKNLLDSYRVARACYVRWVTEVPSNPWERGLFQYPAEKRGMNHVRMEQTSGDGFVRGICSFGDLVFGYCGRGRRESTELTNHSLDSPKLFSAPALALRMDV